MVITPEHILAPWLKVFIDGKEATQLGIHYIVVDDNDYILASRWHGFNAERVVPIEEGETLYKIYGKITFDLHPGCTLSPHRIRSIAPEVYTRLRCQESIQ